MLTILKPRAKSLTQYDFMFSSHQQEYKTTHSLRLTKPGSKYCFEVDNTHDFDPLRENHSPNCGYDALKRKENLKICKAVQGTQALLRLPKVSSKICITIE